MDDDVEPATTALEELLAATKSAPKGILFASRVVSPEGYSMNVPGIDFRRDKDRYVEWDRLLDKGLVAIEETTFVSILVSRTAIAKVGLPIRELFLWGDDTEFSRRCAAFGEAWMCGKSIVVHSRPTSAPLDVWLEKDSAKLSLYKYLYRNHAIIARIYGQTLARRNQRLVFRTAGYSLLLLLHSIRNMIRHRRFRPLIPILGGTLSGLFMPYKFEFPSNPTKEISTSHLKLPTAPMEKLIFHKVTLFGVISGISLLLTLVLTAFFHELIALGEKTSYAITLVLIFVWNFVLVRRWIYPATRFRLSVRNQLLRSIAISVASRTCEWGGYSLLVTYTTMPYLLAVFLVAVSSFLSKFYFLNRYVFGGSEKEYSSRT